VPDWRRSVGWIDDSRGRTGAGTGGEIVTVMYGAREREYDFGKKTVTEVER